MQSGLLMGAALLHGAVCCIMQLCNPNQGQYSSELLTHAYSGLEHYSPQLQGTDQHELQHGTIQQ